MDWETWDEPLGIPCTDWGFTAGHTSGEASIVLNFGHWEMRPGRWEALTQGFGPELSLSNTRNQPVLGVPMGCWMRNRAESLRDGKFPP